MVESVVRLPPLGGGQADSWAALIELAPAFGENWILVGGQMVFLHEVERQATDVRPTDDLDLVVDLRAEPVAAEILRPNLVGALTGKACAVAKISSQSAASRAKHLRDFDSLARLLGPHDRARADLSKSEGKLLSQLLTSPEMTELGRVAIDALVETSS